MDVPLDHHQFEVIDPCFEVDAPYVQLTIWDFVTAGA